MNNYDFSGYATRNDLLCEDGRTIRKDAFKDNDGATVPLIWNHNHKDSQAVLGHALLENRKDGVYAYCTFNDTEEGEHAKQLVHNGDVRSLSIYANKLKQVGGDVIHGSIKELSLVLAGSNPGAYIDFVMAHGEDEDDGLWANYDENALVIYHSSEKESGGNKMNKEELDQQKENGDDNEKKEKKRKKEKNIQEVFNELTEEQQEVVYALIGMALEDANKNENDDDDKKGDGNMKHNVFDNDERKQDYLSHSAQEDIIKLAKSSQVGSLQTALEIYADNNALQHDALSGGFAQNGTGNVTMLFPEYQEVRPGAPELITNDQDWISVVMSKVHKSPISRIRTSQVDIRKINDLRAKGYKKGKEKILAGNFKLVRRTTDPQTVYVKNTLHRDDIIDITDFDYVKYLYDIDRIMLNEELATAMMLGDGRDEGADDKIASDKIRPIWTDDDLYTIHVDLDIDKAKKELQGTGTGVSFGENYIYAEAIINTVLHARENYKGSGTPDFFVTPHMLNVMLLARDMNGRRIYSSKAELASALNVGDIYTAEQFEGKTRTTTDSKKKKILGIIVNLVDYSLGATKRGEVTHFTQFDIDFNQEKSLLETRCSGALTRVYSAIAIEEDVTADSHNIVG
mgnify:FL=1|jgi:hypothetical protein